MRNFAHTYFMEQELEKGLVLSTSHPFSILKAGFEQKPELGSEVETAMRGVLTQLNPSDPGFDLLQYGNNLQGLWSLKSSAQPKPAGEIRLKNKMSSSNSLKSNSPSYETPTVFIAPYLPGITYFDPTTARGYASRIEQNDEAVTIKATLTRQFAVDNPGCVIPFHAPENPGSANQVWQLDVVTSILTSGTYPNLGPIMADMKKNAATVQYLKQQFESGNIDKETLSKLLNNLGV